MLGCGRIGRLHAQILSGDIPGFELVAVADVVPAAAEGVAAATGARVSSIEDLLAADDIDTIAICTSTDTHVEDVYQRQPPRRRPPRPPPPSSRLSN